MMNPEIVVSGLYKAYNDKVVLKDFSCSFEKGSFTIIMGSSGIGKTTLLRILMGLEKADKGAVSYEKEEAKISAVFQENRLCKNITSLLNVKMVAENNGVSDEEIRKVFEDAGLSDIENITVSELSEGMARRVAIIRGLMADYDILFMDEPLRGLDEENYLKTVDLIKEKTKGKTVIMVTHDKNEAKLFNAKVITLN